VPALYLIYDAERVRWPQSAAPRPLTFDELPSVVTTRSYRTTTTVRTRAVAS
jgi:hypothetical protein